MNPIQPTEEQTQFAKELSKKFYWKFQDKTLYVGDLEKSICDMIRHKLAKENWKKLVDIL